ncbi:MAG TPA: DUF4388 domain-containing protein [Verrucomicrobiae bacterium]
MKNPILARDMVEHRTLLDGNTRVCDLLAWFKATPGIHYAAVLHGGRLAGIVGRDQLNARLADKYGYSVLANRPITEIMNSSPVIVHGSMEVHEISRYLLSQPLEGPAFYQDMVVLDADGQFWGLASVKRLLYTQLNQSMEHMSALEQQAAAFAQRSQEDTEFRLFFETCSVPFVMLDGRNQFVQANRKILNLLGYQPGELTPGMEDFRFIEGGVERFKQAHQATIKQLGEDQSRYFVVFRHQDGSQLGTEVMIDMHTTDERLVLSLMRIASKRELETHLKLLREAEARGGKAQSLVNTLIDRRDDTLFMMRKMENMLTVSDQLEQPPELDKATSLHGNLSDFGVADLAQLLIMGGKTGQLRVFNRTASGFVFFENGKMVHAEIGAAQGEAALADIIAVPNGEFNFIYEVSTAKRTISGDPTGILIRLCSRRDEFVSSFH